ncbi:MAG: transketolase-like TK C-terminal-containing protein [Janthinobacterium lividum]
MIIKSINFFRKKHQFIRDKIVLKQQDDNISEEKILEILDSCEDQHVSQSGRFLSQHVLNHLSRYFPQLYSGSADSAHSDGTWVKDCDIILSPHYQGRNIKFGVREFGMMSAANGLAQTKTLIPVVGGFLAFSDYLKAAIRFAAIPRQDLPFLNLAHNYQETVKRGTYIVRDSKNPEIVIYASGSEVKLALDVYKIFQKEQIACRIISFPSFELFDQQEDDYKAKILYHEAKISVSIEAAPQLNWHKFIGKEGLAISVNDYGFSDTSKNIADKSGFTAEKIFNIIKSSLIKLDNLAV